MYRVKLFMVIFMYTLFSKRLKELRLSNNLKQSDMAKILDINERNYQRYEGNNPSLPKIDNLIFLADYFNVSTDYLLGRTDNPKINK